MSKIENLYRKDRNCGKCIQPVFSNEVFSVVKKWEVFEYFNGLFLKVFVENGSIKVSGKSEKTQIPNIISEKVLEVFSEPFVNNFVFYLEALIVKEKPFLILVGGKFEKDSMFNTDEMEHSAYKLGIFPSIPLGKTSEDFSKMETTKNLLEKYKFSKFHKLTFDKEVVSEGLMIRPLLPLEHFGKKVQAKIVRSDFIL